MHYSFNVNKLVYKGRNGYYPIKKPTYLSRLWYHNIVQGMPEFVRYLSVIDVKRYDFSPKSSFAILSWNVVFSGKQEIPEAWNICSLPFESNRWRFYMISEMKLFLRFRDFSFARNFVWSLSGHYMFFRVRALYFSDRMLYNVVSCSLIFLQQMCFGLKLNQINHYWTKSTNAHPKR